MKTICRLLIILAFSCCAPLYGAAASDTGPEKLSSAALFKKFSPGVVLLIGKDSIGSGSVLNDTTILTNWHVVSENKRIVVAFKPQQEGAPLDPEKFVVGDVIKKAPDKDLALVRIKRIPSYVRPIPLGNTDELEIGADVHAIGHPRGEIWTYTKGVISQLRKDFEWRPSTRERFKADVIQTQTPINPGNSGGPLLSDHGHLIGVNSFGRKEAEGMNYAVALSEVKRFVGKLAPSKTDSQKPSQQPQVKKKEPQKSKDTARKKEDFELAYQGRDKVDSGYLRIYDNGANSTQTFYYPYDQSKPVFCFKSQDGLTDAVVMDMNRDGKWNYSVLDKDRNGKFDTIGVHRNGKMTPSSFLSFKDKKVPAGVREAMPRQVPEPGPEPAGSPSFDCTRADTVIKQTICGSDALADLDVTVTALFSRVLQKNSNMKKQITSGQNEWVAGTENMCRRDDVEACLETRYKQRVIYLNVLMLQ